MKRCKAGILTLRYSCNAKYIGLFFLVFAPLRSATQPVVINDSIAIIKDLSRPLQIIKQVNLSALPFKKLQDNSKDFGIVGNEFKYMILKLNSAANVPGQYLSIDNTSLDTVSIYKIHDDGTSVLIYQGGSLVIYDNRRNYVWHTAPLEISSAPSYYLFALKASQKNINVRYEILDKDDLQKKYQAYERFVFFYTGVVSMIAAIILFAFIVFKKTVFIVYLGYIICVSGWILSHYCCIFPFLYPNFPIINEIAKPVSSLGTGIFLIVVLHLVFKQRLQYHVWLRELLKWMLYILLLLAGSMVFLIIPGVNDGVKYALIIFWHIGLIVSACIIAFTLIFFIKYDLTAKIFSTAMLVICLMAMVQLFGNLGHIKNVFINEHGMAIGSLLEICIMAFGLFYSLLEEKKSKEIRVSTLENEQTEILKKLITVQDNERKRIAGDLHDNIGPLLAALKINFRRIIRTKDGDLQNGLVAKTESIIDDSIAEIRNIAHNLMPKGLSSNGLTGTLNDYFEGIQQLYNKTIVFNHQVQSILNPELQTNVYRIICELVLNAARHSNALVITVRILANENLVSIRVHDDGQGFQPKSNNKSLGLQNAESRVLYLKGKFTLTSEPGKGAGIEMEIPL